MVHEIIVKKVGEHSGFCREYFKDEQGRLFAKQEEWPGVYEWSVCSPDGEPSYGVPHNIKITVKEV